MFRKLAVRLSLLTPAPELASRLGTLALESAAARDATAIRREARELVKATNIDPSTLTGATCLESLQHCADFAVPPTDKTVEIMNMWLEDHASGFQVAEWKSLTSSLAPHTMQFWKTSVLDRCEDAFKASLATLSPDDALAVAQDLRGFIPDDHFTIQQAFITSRQANLTSLLDVFGPLVPFRRELSEQAAQHVAACPPEQLPNILITVATAGLTGCDAVAIGLDRMTANIHAIDAAAGIEAVETLVRHGIESDSAALRGFVHALVPRCDTVELTARLADALHWMPPRVSAVALIRPACDAAVVMPEPNFNDKASQAKCAAMVLDTARVKAFLNTATKQVNELDFRSLKAMMEVCIVADTFPDSVQLNAIAAHASRNRNSASTHDLAVVLFALGAAQCPADVNVQALAATVASRCRLTRTAEQFAPMTVALLLRGLHLLDQLTDEATVDFLVRRASSVRGSYNVLDCCHLLVVARSVGARATELTNRLVNQIAASIPFAHPAHIGIIAQTFAVCYLRDVAVFEQLAHRTRHCVDAGLTEEATLDILDAFEKANLESTLGEQTLKTIAARFGHAGSADIAVELLLWAQRLGVQVDVSTGAALPSTLRGQVDYLAIRPTAECLQLVIASTNELKPQEIIERIAPRRLIAAAVSVVKAPLPDDETKTVLHRFAMAVGHAAPQEASKHVDAMVTVVGTLGERRLTIGSIFRVFGMRIANEAGTLKPMQIVSVLEAYAALGIPDDSVVRALLLRIVDTKIEKNKDLARRVAEVKEAFGAWSKKA
jgi:hypothetical protein